MRIYQHRVAQRVERGVRTLGVMGSILGAATYRTTYTCDKGKLYGWNEWAIYYTLLIIYIIQASNQRELN